MLTYGGVPYAKVKFIFGIKGLYYITEMYISNEELSVFEGFPSREIMQMADLIYCIDTDKFIKFRWYKEEQYLYRNFFTNAVIREVTLFELIKIIENEYTVKLKH